MRSSIPTTLGLVKICVAPMIAQADTPALFRGHELDFGNALLWRDLILVDLEAALKPWLGGAAYLKKGTLLATPHFQLIKRTANFFTQYDLEKPLAIDTLACSLGVSQRTLYHAFRESLGVGPYAYFQLIRLHKLRDRLLTASPSEASVISLASDLGFNQAGRLSVAYRKHFGESPGETLMH